MNVSNIIIDKNRTIKNLNTLEDRKIVPGIGTVAGDEKISVDGKYEKYVMSNNDGDEDKCKNVVRKTSSSGTSYYWDLEIYEPNKDKIKSSFLNLFIGNINNTGINFADDKDIKWGALSINQEPEINSIILNIYYQYFANSISQLNRNKIFILKIQDNLQRGIKKELGSEWFYELINLFKQLKEATLGTSISKKLVKKQVNEAILKYYEILFNQIVKYLKQFVIIEYDAKITKNKIKKTYIDLKLFMSRLKFILFNKIFLAALKKFKEDIKKDKIFSEDILDKNFEINIKKEVEKLKKKIAKDLELDDELRKKALELKDNYDPPSFFLLLANENKDIERKVYKQDKRIRRLEINNSKIPKKIIYDSKKSLYCPLGDAPSKNLLTKSKNIFLEQSLKIMDSDNDCYENWENLFEILDFENSKKVYLPLVKINHHHIYY